MVKILITAILAATSLNILAQDSFKSSSIDDSKYFLSSSAKTIKKGEWYYQNTYLLVNSFQYGITNNISAGAGVELLSPILTNEFKPNIFLNIKGGIAINKNLNIATKLTFLTSPNFGKSNINAGLADFLCTYSTEKFNITGGLGWAYVKKETDRRPIFTISGAYKLSNKFYLISDNKLIPTNQNYYGLYSYGVRYSTKRISLDFAFLNNKDFSNIFPIGLPYLGLTLKPKPKKNGT